MTVAQTFLIFAGRLACILALSFATVLCAITPSLFATEENSVVAESDLSAANISHHSDPALPAADPDSFDEPPELTGDAAMAYCAAGEALLAASA
jgi:hypothetical protein